MMSPKDARLYIQSQGANYGQNVILPDHVDTCNCDEFFGTRCEYSVHVTGTKRAHIDRKDPRDDPVGHLKHDVGVPYSIMTTAAGVVIGALASKNNRKKGVLLGGLFGLGIGILADLASEN